VTKHRRHVPPIPDQADHPVRYRWLQLRWRLAVAAVVYPVQIAVTLALVVCAVPVYLVLESQARLKDQADAQAAQADVQAAQQKQIADLVTGIQTSRVKATGDICRVLDRNTRITNAQLALFQTLIVSGAKQSRIFDNLYKQFGAPDYPARVRQAQRYATKIGRLKLPLPNCTAALTRIGPLHPPPVAHGNP
jgi:hypothetical protein